jgi:hypothetical protein
LEAASAVGKQQVRRAACGEGHRSSPSQSRNLWQSSEPSRVTCAGRASEQETHRTIDARKWLERQAKETVLLLDRLSALAAHRAERARSQTELPCDVYPSRVVATATIADYIENFYNPQRRHSHLDYVSPIEFELRAQSAAFAA